MGFIFAIMTVICLVLSLFGIDDISDIIALIINLVVMGFIAFYAWKYSQNAKQMQTLNNWHKALHLSI